ncbi:hypothetical protein BJX65DRAFT_153774 [Aspergillus insuetus]
MTSTCTKHNSSPDLHRRQVQQKRNMQLSSHPECTLELVSPRESLENHAKSNKWYDVVWYGMWPPFPNLSAFGTWCIYVKRFNLEQNPYHGSRR